MSDGRTWQTGTWAEILPGDIVRALGKEWVITALERGEFTMEIEFPGASPIAAAGRTGRPVPTAPVVFYRPAAVMVLGEDVARPGSGNRIFVVDAAEPPVVEVDQDKAAAALDALAALRREADAAVSVVLPAGTPAAAMDWDDSERQAAAALRAQFEVKVIERVLTLTGLLAHLVDHHDAEIPDRGPLIGSEYRGRLADLHFELHPAGRSAGAVPHTHPAMDRPADAQPEPGRIKA